MAMAMGWRAALAALLGALAVAADRKEVKLQRFGQNADWTLCEVDLYVKDSPGGAYRKVGLRDATGSERAWFTAHDYAIDGDYEQDHRTGFLDAVRNCFNTNNAEDSPVWSARFDWPSSDFHTAYRLRVYPRTDEQKDHGDHFLGTRFYVDGVQIYEVTERKSVFTVEVAAPTSSPTKSPSPKPTKSPTTPEPTGSPTRYPTRSPDADPTVSPTAMPSASPVPPSNSPTMSPVTPTSSPSSSPSAGPSAEPTSSPVAYIGACENAGDKELWNSRDVMADMDDIDPVCTGTPDYRTCSARWFFESAKYSRSCAECLGEMAGCLETRCSCPEGQEMQGSCLSCFEARCVAPFETCAGVLMSEEVATNAPTASNGGGPPSPGGAEAGTSPTTMIAVGGGVGGALLLAAVAATLFVRGRRKRMDVDAIMGAKVKVDGGDDSRETMNPAFASVAVSIPPASRAPRSAPRVPRSRPPTLPRPAEVRPNAPAVMLFDCEGQAEDELSGAEGTVLVAIERVNNEWWWCENPATEERGLVPANILGGKP